MGPSVLPYRSRCSPLVVGCTVLGIVLFPVLEPVALTAQERPEGPYVEFSGIRGWRGNGALVPLASNRTSPAAPALLGSLTTRDVDFGGAWGGRVTFGNAGDGGGLEVSYSTTREWRGRGSFRPESRSIPWGNGMPGWPQNFLVDPPFDYAVERDMRYHDASVSALSELRPGTSAQFGLRYFRATDRLTATVTGTGLGGTAGRTERLTVAAGNDLLGGEVGLRHRFGQGRAGLAFESRAGIFLNLVDDVLEDRTDANPTGPVTGVLVFVEGDEAVLATLVDIGARFEIDLDRGRLFIGGRLQSVSGMALAADQLALLGDGPTKGLRTIDVDFLGPSHGGALRQWTALAGFRLWR